MTEDKEKNLYKALRLACEGERIGVLVEENGGVLSFDSWKDWRSR